MNPADDSGQKVTDTSAAMVAGSGVSKEAEVPKTPVPEVGKEQVEHEVSKEVADHVTVVEDSVEIPPDLKQVGVSHAPSDQAVSSQSNSQSTTLPLTDDQIGEGLTKKPTTSFRWLAEWCARQLRIMHMHLKKVHGHFIRVKDQ